jgi:hypothetical protein
MLLGTPSGFFRVAGARRRSMRSAAGKLVLRAQLDRCDCTQHRLWLSPQGTRSIYASAPDSPICDMGEGRAVPRAMVAGSTLKAPALAHRFLSRGCLAKARWLRPETLGSTSACASSMTVSMQCQCGRMSTLSTAKSSRTARRSLMTLASTSSRGTAPRLQDALRGMRCPTVPMMKAWSR